MIYTLFAYHILTNKIILTLYFSNVQKSILYLLVFLFCLFAVVLFFTVSSCALFAVSDSSGGKCSF